MKRKHSIFSDTVSILIYLVLAAIAIGVIIYFTFFYSVPSAF